MKRLIVISGILTTLLLSSLTALAQTPQNQTDRQKKEAEARRAEFKQKARTLVASKEERSRYAEFLKLPHTGLIRLLPRERYISEAYADAMPSKAGAPSPGSFQRKLNEEGPGSSLPGPIGPRGGSTSAPTPNTGVLTNLDDLPPHIDPSIGKNRGRAHDGGAFYSFSRLTHAYGYGSDIALEQGQFGVGFAGADYGFITNIGDVPLEAVTLQTPEAMLLAEYIPAQLETDARSEHRRFGQGVDVNGMTVKSRLPMKLNSTYVLRAINYDQADMLVAFRVVEIDSEGTPLILWKRLKKFSTPELVRVN